LLGHCGEEKNVPARKGNPAVQPVAYLYRLSYVGLTKEEWLRIVLKVSQKVEKNWDGPE
jgi:hypothetical protein